MNDHAIEPFTAGIARASTGAVDLLGQHTTRERILIRGALRGQRPERLNDAHLRFAVLAFPATWRGCFAGLAPGIGGIQAVNQSPDELLNPRKTSPPSAHLYTS